MLISFVSANNDKVSVQHDQIFLVQEKSFNIIYSSYVLDVYWKVGISEFDRVHNELASISLIEWDKLNKEC